MRILVTATDAERAYTEEINLYGLVGAPVVDFEYDNIDEREMAIFNNHMLKGDILVYFPKIDFCYWIALGEFKIVEETKERK